MKFPQSEFAEWKRNPITQALLEDLAETATDVAQRILTDSTFDRDKIQHLRGTLQGLGTVAGWAPEIIKDTEDGEDATP